MRGTRIRWEVGMRWQLTAFAIAVVLAGCATPDPYTNDLLTASIAPGTGRKSIGVISAIGDAFSVQKLGLTVFQNALDEIPIDAWVVAYCACPHHLSGVVVDSLRSRGYPHAYVLDEGILEWERRGYPIVAAPHASLPPLEAQPPGAVTR